ncbi:MAG: hypothetical protein IT584_01995 [Chlamydiae bacterium]|nr:hypothetical protein [Chlamydiota bacterium]
MEFILEFLKTPIEENRNLSMFFRAAVYSILFLSAEDPSRLHYQAARETLQEIGGDDLASEEKARDLLARALVKQCQLFAKNFLPVSWENERIFSPNGLLDLDERFARELEKIGPLGKEMGRALIEASKSWKKNYDLDQNGLALFRLWVDFDIPPYYCRYLKLFAEILWKDSVEAQFQRDQKHLPALTLTVQRPLSRLFSSRVSSVVRDEKTSLFYEGKIVAEAHSLEPKYATLLAKGIQNLGSIYHHKLLRLECQRGYENWISGKTDPQIIRFDRGETQIAELLGFKCKQAPSIIKSLLYAQSCMTFYFDDQNTSQLISLEEFSSQCTHRSEGLQIALSPQLMPNYTFQTDRRGRLLVPLSAFPPFVSAPQYHAGQALLQMVILEEFTNQSIELATNQSIEITEDKWREFLKKSNLPLSVYKAVLQQWIGHDPSCLLTPIAEDRYALGPSYAKEHKFLSSQGSLRKNRQIQAQISVRKRRASN